MKVRGLPIQAQIDQLRREMQDLREEFATFKIQFEYSFQSGTDTGKTRAHVLLALVLTPFSRLKLTNRCIYLKLEYSDVSRGTDFRQ
jgi:hypothetical protein